MSVHTISRPVPRVLATSLLPLPRPQCAPLLLQRQMRAVFAGAEHQRLALAVGRTLDATEEHDVIATDDARLLDALERCQRPEQERTAAEARCVDDALELVRVALGEMLRKRELPGSQDIDGEMAGLLERAQ